MVKVKICGITNKQDALNAIESGADALGFVFYKRSPRYIKPENARSIIKDLPKWIIRIGVFVNAREKTVLRIARLCNLNMLQFHGAESPSFCGRFKKHKVIKAFRLKNKLDPSQVEKYKTFAYLFDTFVDTKIGGTGRKFDWKLIRHVGRLRSPIFLSGGLSEKNIREAILCVVPDWLDVSSSLELAPGKKDHHKVRRFIREAKSK